MGKAHNNLPEGIISLIEQLRQTRDEMDRMSIVMIDGGYSQNIQNHGHELWNAATMIEDWIYHIKMENKCTSNAKNARSFSGLRDLKKVGTYLSHALKNAGKNEKGVKIKNINKHIDT